MTKSSWEVVTVSMVLSALAACTPANGKEPAADKGAEKTKGGLAGGASAAPADPTNPGPTTAPIPGCRTPFALADAAPGPAGCTVPPGQDGRWAVVPRRRSAQSPPPSSDVRRATPDSPGLCVYRWKPAGFPTKDDLNAIKAQPECSMTAGMQAAARPAVAPPFAPLAAAFDWRARGVMPASLTAAAARAEVDPKKLPQIDVVDATPFDLRQMDTSGHGFAVSNVIAALACSDPSSAACVDMIRPRLALPLVESAPGRGDWHDDPRGGVIGHFHDLFDAVEESLDLHVRGRNQIINLSLAWDPIKTDPDSREVVQMTGLLKRAFCNGVLVVAAAGNVTGSDGPMVPAALEKVTPPDATWCAKMTYPAPPAEKTLSKVAHPYRVLLHSVSGVDLRDERLSSSRPWGHSRLAAYGEEVTVPVRAGSPTGFTPPMTGTSMSAAIVTGIAGALWTSKPALGPNEVMARIYQGGRQLDGTTSNRRSRCEFCWTGPGERCDVYPVRRASLCGAMNQVLSTASSLTCVDPTAPPGSATIRPVKGVASSAAPPCRLTGCGLAVGPDSEQLPVAVLPTPGIARCPGCVLTQNNPLTGFGTVSGTATVVPTGMLGTVLRVTNPDWTYQDFWIATPPAGTAFARTIQPMPVNPPTATILWFYNLGAGQLTDYTPLKVQ